jgi:putative ABC transport system ATP-binding protein
MSGRHAAQETDAEPSLSACEVSFARSGRVILDRVSISASPGTVTAIMGPSGSGKSSMLAILAGLEEPDSGSVHRSPADARIGLVLQAYGLASLLTAAENVEIPLQGGICGPMSSAEIRDRSTIALEAVALDAVRDHLVEELSGGQQQRVAIARALAIEPDLLLADEFTAELDEASRHRMLERVFSIAERGGTVVMATHDHDVASRCDSVIRIVDGRVA